MGLDQYAFIVAKKDLEEPNEVVDVALTDEMEPQELAYFRKFNHLHGWMERLYRAKGGTQEFNCTTVMVTEEDLDRLEADFEAGEVPATEGFFFGSDELHEEDLKSLDKFIKDAREAIKDGFVVFYDSWW